MNLRKFYIRKTIGFLILAAIIGVVVGFNAFNDYIYNEKQQENTFEPYRATLTGEYVCLPLKEGMVSEKDCEFGLKTDVDEYFAINFNLMSQIHEPIAVGERISATGVVTPVARLSSTAWRKYPVEGIFSVTDSLNQLEVDEEEFERNGETWTRYRNDDLGIRFEYRIEPDGYLLIEQEGVQYPSDDVVAHISLFDKEEYLELVTSSAPREGPPGITIMVFDNPNDYSVHEWVEEEALMSNYQPESLSASLLEDVEFSGVPAVRYTYDGLYTNDTIVALNNRRVYLISGGYFDENSTIRQDFIEILNHTSLY